MRPPLRAISIQVNMMCLISSHFIRGIGIAICTLTIAASSVAAASAADSAGMPRVRSGHAYIRAMIEEAAERSDTFRRLVKAVEATDGIVYVEQGKCGHSVRACLTLHVTPAADFRILRVMVDARQPDWNVMASIGHELQHALEVLGEASLKTSEAVFLFYNRVTSRTDTFETSAAIAAGNAVHSEVGSYAKRKLS
ncbi:MAG: hypothetical protein ABJA98_32410 [Acidobacteriota bacterium]